MKLEEIRKLCDEATPRPWINTKDAFIPTIDTERFYCEISGPEQYQTYFALEDAKFIAMARDKMEKLLAVAEAAREAWPYMPCNGKEGCRSCNIKMALEHLEDES